MIARPLRSLAKTTLALGGILTAQLLYAIRRTDLPSLEDQPLEGTFGRESSPPFRLAFAGDSTVTAPGVEPPDAAWACRVAAFLAAEYRVELVVTAEGGSRAADVLERQVPRLLEIEPDLVVVSVGGNDALRGTPVRRFEETYDRILDLLAPRSAVIAAAIGDLGTIPRLPAIVRGVARVRGRAIDRAIARSVARHPGVEKTDASGPEWDVFGTDPELWAGDLFHASAAGHALYADGTVPALNRALGRIPPPLPAGPDRPSGDGSST